jgi:chromatin-remodeling ATPase INO80
VGNKNFTDVTKPSEIVQLLLNDEQLASLQSSSRLSANEQAKSTGEKATQQEPMQDLWNEEGDDFFGHTASAPAERQDEDNVAMTSQSIRGNRRKSGAGTARGRKTGSKKKPSPTETSIET